MRRATNARTPERTQLTRQELLWGFNFARMVNTVAFSREMTSLQLATIQKVNDLFIAASSLSQGIRLNPRS